VPKPRRDPAEVAALIEQGLSRGMDLVESWVQATGSAPKGSAKALAKEHRKAVEANRRSLKSYRKRRSSAQSQLTAGATVAGVTGVIGVLDVVTEAATDAAAVPFPAWAWLTAAAIGVVVSLRGRARLRGLGPEPELLDPVAPPPALRSGRPGSVEVRRLTTARAQVVAMAPALDRLYPGSGAELRRADQDAAGPLTALAERLVVLDQLQRDLPGTSAAAQAAASGEIVRSRLAQGCDTYDALLSAAARLLSEPDMGRSTDDVLGPAIRAMVAYAHGLQRAADL
jgi:hypothetical protein